MRSSSGDQTTSKTSPKLRKILVDILLWLGKCKIKDSHIYSLISQISPATAKQHCRTKYHTCKDDSLHERTCMLPRLALDEEICSNVIHQSKLQTR